MPIAANVQPVLPNRAASIGQASQCGCRTGAEVLAAGGRCAGLEQRSGPCGRVAGSAVRQAATRHLPARRRLLPPAPRPNKIPALSPRPFWQALAGGRAGGEASGEGGLAMVRRPPRSSVFLPRGQVHRNCVTAVGQARIRQTRLSAPGERRDDLWGMAS